jgi:hypothetical protein
LRSRLDRSLTRRNLLILCRVRKRRALSKSAHFFKKAWS